MTSVPYRTFCCVALLLLGGIVGWWLTRTADSSRPTRGVLGTMAETPVTQDDGVELYLTHCAACHGERAEGKKESMAGALASMPRWYLEEQLQKFRAGQRGAHPKDEHGQVMRAVVETLELGEQRKILDYLGKMPPVAQESTLGGDVAWGKELYEVNCAMCHRYNGHGMVGFKSAPLNGQQDWYLLAQMEKFDQKIRGYHADDVSGRKMHKEMAATPSSEDRLAILAYLCRLSEQYPTKKNQQ